MLLDQDFASRLALSQGREMLAQTSLRNTSIKFEGKHHHDEKTTTTPVHDMRTAEPIFSHSELVGTGLAQAKTKSKTSVLDGDEKPSWGEVIMQSTTDVSSLLADEASGLEVPRADGHLALVPQQKHDGHYHPSVSTRPSEDYECASASALQMDALQMSMIEMKTEMSESVNVASAAQQSRMDSLEASLEASLDAVGAKLEAQFSEQGRTGERLSDLELAIQRIEKLLVVKVGTATEERGDDR